MKAYKKEFDFTYTSGAYATSEMLLAKPWAAEKIYIHSDFIDKQGLVGLCKEKGVDYEFNDVAFRKVNKKENSYVLGKIAKYPLRLDESLPHVVLVNPSDMGNLGTIIRTLVGFGITNLVIVTPAADVWNPKVIRASMGAFFRMKFEEFSSFEEYQQRFSGHQIYPFMLDSELELSAKSCPTEEGLYTLVFGNEATGLSDDFRKIGTSVKLPQSTDVDSLNLAVAVGVGAFIFSQFKSKGK